MAKLTGYDLTRQWFEMVWEHPEITANDTALYLWLCEIWNKIGQPETFQITSKECMQGMSARNYHTFKKSFDKLKEMGCYNLVKQSTNQYQCNVIALLKFDKASSKALDKAFSKARSKASSTFIKPNKPITLNPEPNKHYADCIGLYNSFCLERLNVPAKIDGAQGNAMKAIIKYFESLPKIKDGSHTVTQTMEYVFKNWNSLNDFLRGKIKLTDINSNLQNILENLKNPIKNGKQKSTADDFERVAEALWGAGKGK